MTGTCDANAVTLARDNAAKNFSWYISPGRPMTSVRYKSSFAPRAWMPPRPAETSTEAHSSKYFATWHLLGSRLTRPPLNQRLQSYFRRMQHVMTRICHPLSIHNEACSIVHSVKNAGFVGQPRLLAEGLFMHAVGVHLKEFATSTLLHIFHNVCRSLVPSILCNKPLYRFRAISSICLM